MRIGEIQVEQAIWAERNFGDRPTWHPLLGAVEEIGELAHAHLKQEQGIRMDEDHESNAKDAVADTVIYLLDYCNRRGWDLETLVSETWVGVVSKRDWKADKYAVEGVTHG